MNEVLNLQKEIQDELIQTALGLSWLPHNYFEDHISTTEDTENWKKGFAFQLPSIMHEKEFRRCNLINDIKNRLEDKHRLLLVGESGTSKTTLLMEILTDYFAEGYEILYNLDRAEIKNGLQVVRFIERRLDIGDKILVVVDDVHTERTSAIFYAMDVISSVPKKKQNVIFLLGARLPEYDSFVKDRLNLINEGKDAIMKFNLDSKFRYDLPFFTQDEIKGFIKKYMGEKIFPNGLTIAEYEELVSNFILKATGGHPIAIMIKFYLLGGGLHTDVERRYNDYLIDDSRKIRIMLVCSLLDRLT